MITVILIYLTHILVLEFKPAAREQTFQLIDASLKFHPIIKPD
jgi:hypothetical protein